MAPPTLLAVPNVSEGRDEETIAAIATAFAGEATEGPARGVELLDVHTDRDHHRSVFTIAGSPGALADALLRGAAVAVERIDVMTRAGGRPEDAGQHPHVGAIDVAPVVYLDPRDRGAACAEALVIGDRIGEELQVPVFLYGELSGTDASSASGDDPPARTRAQLRRGGVAGLRARMAGERKPQAERGIPGTAAAGDPQEPIAPDFGPPRMHPTAGATLVAARPPLVAFNVQLAPALTIEDARALAALIREGGSAGLPGVRAMGVALGDGSAQVSMNVERPSELPLARVIEAIRAHAELAGAELVGLAPAAAFADFPPDLPIPGFDPARHLIENALGS
jgi:glutamate formiminotransferase/glutamate formiminotransferase/formiminotetrahydrofolate cyclodeaminase